MGISQISAWDVYIRQVQQYLDKGTLEYDEIGYKLEIAEDLGKARKSVIARNDNWYEDLNHALRGRGGHPWNWRQVPYFYKWCQSKPSDVLDALHGLWNNQEASLPERIRDFTRILPNRVARGKGVRTRLLAGLLMGLDVEQHPPFQITLFNGAYDRTGYPPPEPNSDEADLYEHALGFLDRLIEEASQRGVKLRHRLDAQSVMWQIQGDTSDDQFDEDDPDDAPEQDLAELAEKIYLTQKFLENIQTLLEDKKQVIFQGPPGTGKTYLALQLANHLAGSEERVTLVQFTRLMHTRTSCAVFVRG